MISFNKKREEEEKENFCCCCCYCIGTNAQSRDTAHSFAYKTRRYLECVRVLGAFLFGIHAESEVVLP